MQKKCVNEDHNYRFVRITKHVCATAVIAILLYSLGVAGLHRSTARQVLHRAKMVRLVTQNTYYDYYDSDTTFIEADGSIKKDEEKEILELSHSDGTIYHVEFDENSFRVKRLIYEESGYVVDFTDTGNDPQWIVYRLDKLID